MGTRSGTQGRDDRIVAEVVAGATLEQVAHAHGLTRQRVSQIMRSRRPEWDGATRRTQRAALARAAKDADTEGRAAARRLEVRWAGRPRVWTDDAILAALADAAPDGRSPSVRAWRIRDGGPSVTVVIARFGSWNTACAAAGLTTIPPPRTNRRRATDEELIAALVRYLSDPELHDRGGVRGYSAWAKRSGAAAPATLRARFGSWSAAKGLAVRQLNTEHGNLLAGSTAAGGNNGADGTETEATRWVRPESVGVPR